MNEKIRNFLRIDKSGRIRNFFRRENLAKLFHVEKIKAFFLADRLTDRLKAAFPAITFTKSKEYDDKMNYL